MKLVAVCIGAALPVPGRKSKSGINKQPVDYPVMVGREGLAGDRIVNRKYHGGPDQAVYLEGSADRKWWEATLGRPFPAGVFGENLLVDGLHNTQIAVGDRFSIGDLLLEVTSARHPCSTFAIHMEDTKFVKTYIMAGRPGPYCRVLSEGIIRVGDKVEYQPYGGERVTMPELMQTYGKKLEGLALDRYLSTPIHQKLRTFLSE